MRGTAGGEDESLEIVFWWLGDDPKRSIEDDLDDYLDESAPRRQRWRKRRRVAAS